MEEKRIAVDLEASGARIDAFLAQQFKATHSRTAIKRLIEKGFVRLNGHAVKAHTPVAKHDEILIQFEEVEETTDLAEALPIDVVYEDEEVIVVNKAAGMVVHPASGNPRGTLVNALLHYTQSLSQLGEANRRGIVHRLDKDTSGLMVVAKTDLAHRLLAEQFEQHRVEKCYWVVVKGVMQHDEMRSEAPLGKSTQDRKKVIVKYDDGKESMTNFKVLKRFHNATLLEARPKTGRTHQIRVHLKDLGYPVLGDLTYGVPSELISRQALHAKELGFTHPKTNKRLLFRSEIPADMADLVDSLGQKAQK